MASKVLTNASGLALTNPSGRLLAVDQTLRATTRPALAPRVDVPATSSRWAAVGQWDVLTATQAQALGIVMPFPTAINNYSLAADQPTYTLTFQVSGTPGEGVQILGCCEDQSPTRLWLNGQVLLPALGTRSRYTELRTVLCAVFGLPAGTHTLGLQKLATTQGTGDGHGLLIGGAYVYTRVSSYQ